MSLSGVAGRGDALGGPGRADLRIEQEAGPGRIETALQESYSIAGAEMVAEVLGESGIGARVLPPVAVSQDAIGQLDLAGADVVCLSYFNPQPQVFARYVCRRLKRRAPG